MSDVKNQNKMGIMPINKLLISMSAPMMASMLVQALYNVVDSIFVSQITNDDFPLTALSLAAPAQTLMVAVGVGTGVGVNALLSRKLGEKDFDGANRIATAGVFLAFCSYIVFALLGVFAVRPFFEMQTTNSEIVEYGVQYLSICYIFSFGFFLQVLCERLMQSTGKTLYIMYCQGLGAIINIIFDPIFIFVFKMGVSGAAIATVLGQICAMLLAVFLHHHKNKEVRIDCKKLFKPQLNIIRNIYGVALPSIVMQSIGSVMVFLLNKILISFTETATAVFGVYFKLQSFVFMPVFGLNNGMVPIVSYNYGAENRKRITKTIKLSLVYSFVIMFVGLVIIQLIPDKIFMLFNATEQTQTMGVVALRIISLHFPLAAFAIILSSVFQALGKAVRSMIVSIARQIVVLLPAAYLLSLTGTVDAVWWAFPIAEVVSLALCIIFYIGIYKK